MATRVPASASRELVAEVERRLEALETLRDPTARELADAAVAAVLELYGAGLQRIVELVAPLDDGALALALADDELVSHLLVLHGLHPVSVEDRVRAALHEVRPYLESHGGSVELLEVEGATVHLRLGGSCSGCPSSSMTLKLAVENAIRKLAPEIEEVRAQDAAPSPAPLLTIENLAGARPAGTDAGLEDGWRRAGGLPELAGGGLVAKDIAGQRTLFLKLGERLYAYRPACPACRGSLEHGTLTGTEMTCGGCGRRYDVLRAGRCLDSPQLHLEPIPLLMDGDGLVRVAVAA